jgi:hypothetical protein
VHERLPYSRDKFTEYWTFLDSLATYQEGLKIADLGTRYFEISNARLPGQIPNIKISEIRSLKVGGVEVDASLALREAAVVDYSLRQIGKIAPPEDRVVHNIPADPTRKRFPAPKDGMLALNTPNLCAVMADISLTTEHIDVVRKRFFRWCKGYLHRATSETEESDRALKEIMAKEISFGAHNIPHGILSMIQGSKEPKKMYHKGARKLFCASAVRAITDIIDTTSLESVKRDSRFTSRDVAMAVLFMDGMKLLDDEFWLEVCLPWARRDKEVIELMRGEITMRLAGRLGIGALKDAKQW